MKCLNIIYRNDVWFGLERIQTFSTCGIRGDCSIKTTVICIFSILISVVNFEQGYRRGQGWKKNTNPVKLKTTPYQSHVTTIGYRSQNHVVNRTATITAHTLYNIRTSTYTVRRDGHYGFTTRIKNATSESGGTDSGC